MTEINSKRKKPEINKSVQSLQHAVGMGKLPPQAIDCEEVVLGALMIDFRDNILTRVKALITAECFYKESHQMIFNAIITLESRKTPTDIILVTQELKSTGKLDLVGGAWYITQLTNRVASGANIEFHASVVKEKFVERELIRLAHEISKEAYDDTTFAMDLMEKMIRELDEIKSKQTRKAVLVSMNDKAEKNVDLLFFNNRRILSLGNITALVAPPGTGKSSVCEAIATAAVWNECDSMGFKTMLMPGDKLLYVDTERSVEDTKKAMANMGKRAMINKNTDLLNSAGFFHTMDYLRMIEVPSKVNRQLELELMIKQFKYKIVILDGITDFIKDVNDIGEASEFIAWLIALANTQKLGLFVTIHDNPAAAQTKPRGHIGSELYRKCEGMLLMKKAPEDKTMRLITSDFDYGKNRNDSDVGMNKWIQWSKEWSQMRTVEDFEPSSKTTASIGLLEKFQTLFLKKKRYLYSDLRNAYMETFGIKTTAAKDHIASATDMEIIRKDPVSNLYMLGDEIPF